MDCRILSKAHIIICLARSLPQHGLQNGDNPWPPATCWSCPGSPSGRIAPLLPLSPCAMSSSLPRPMKSGWPHHLRRGLECLFRRVLPLDRSVRPQASARFTPEITLATTSSTKGLGRTRRAGWCPVRDGFRVPWPSPSSAFRVGLTSSRETIQANCPAWSRKPRPCCRQPESAETEIACVAHLTGAGIR